MRWGAGSRVGGGGAWEWSRRGSGRKRVGVRGSRGRTARDEEGVSEREEEGMQSFVDEDARVSPRPC